MNKRLLFIALFIANSLHPLAQNGWKICTAPVFKSRVDDIFMIHGQTGYAVCGDGQIVKSTDSGNTWRTIFRDTNMYFRSVEFINEQIGFVGGFPFKGVHQNIFLKTLDGGNTWHDLTPNIAPRARGGICGLAVADSNTIYGCGNWFTDSAYIIKSYDGGFSWIIMDMRPYATSLIDLYFTSKDTGFATGRAGIKYGDPSSAIILYTTDGGITWTKKFENNDDNEYCWKIQRLTDKVYFASIQDYNPADSNKPSILKSVDGGMSWTKYFVRDSIYNIEGIGFIDSLKGFTGGGKEGSFESVDGGKTWIPNSICPYMDRVFRVSDNVLFATGFQIWKYERGTNVNTVPIPGPSYIYLKCYPNPVSGFLEIDFTLSRATRAVLNIYDGQGKTVRQIVNADEAAGGYHYSINTGNYANGVYYVLLRTHEDKQAVKVIVNH